MEDRFQSELGAGHTTYGMVLREVALSAKDLVSTEMNLLKAEIKDSAQTIAHHSAQAAIFGAVLALSIIPFVAFLVIGLGELLGGRYWLSALIVAVLFAAVGGIFAYRAYKKIKEQDYSLPRTRRALEEVKEEIKTTVTGASHATDRLH
jgi:hypothetical protein